jgi:hypothetical protein
MSCFSVQAVTAREIVPTDGAAARRTACNALQHVETARHYMEKIMYKLEENSI